jgi:hypothetical protein
MAFSSVLSENTSATVGLRLAHSSTIASAAALSPTDSAARYACTISRMLLRVVTAAADGPSSVRSTAPAPPGLMARLSVERIVSLAACTRGGGASPAPRACAGGLRE